MRALLFVALALVPALAVPTPAGAQTGSEFRVPSSEIAHGWYLADDGRLDLYWRGEKIGSLELGTRNSELGTSSAIWQTAGKTHTIDLNAVFADPHPGGVQADAIPQGASYEVNGKTASRDNAFKVLRGGGDALIDDTAKPFLTAVLPDGQRQQFLADMDTSPALAPFKGKLHVNAYAPTDWQVSQIGLSAGVSFQAPPDAAGKSKVLFRLREYAGPEALATALRTPDGGYKPDADPDPTKQPAGGKSPTPPADASTTIDTEAAATWGGFGVGMASILAWVLRRRWAS